MWCRWLVFTLIAITLTTPSAVRAQLPKDQKVKAATRLDWEFASKGFGAAALKLPANYDSTKQRYQLFIPAKYDAAKRWPLVLFISPSDQPTGWKAWQKVCEDEGVFFASPFGAGNNVPAGQRTRIVLDVLDDLRRSHSIDPDQTYLAGFSGGGRMACAIALALPELFGGVAPVCGTNPIGGATYLRHRLQDRFSVALVTGEKDFNRKENETYLAPWLDEIGVRSKLWVAPKVAHDIPGPETMAEVYRWLRDDLPRRQAEATKRPELALAAHEAPAAAESAQRLLKAAEAELAQPARTWRGVALLQGTVQRWPATDAGRKAKSLLQKIGSDEKLLALIAEQGADDEVKAVSAQAKAFERFGMLDKATEAWSILLRNYADTPVARDAQQQIERLRGKKKG
jgi:dienelactone hydrolase